jgi:hypothetical protein
VRLPVGCLNHATPIEAPAHRWHIPPPSVVSVPQPCRTL